MSDRFAPDDDALTDAAGDANAQVLQQAIAHVDQLLERLDRKPADDTSGADRAGGPAAQLAATITQLSGPVGVRAEALEQATQLILVARDSAERLRVQAHHASMDAAARGRQLVSDAVHAAAALQTDAERRWDECEEWASDQFRAADEAIRTLLAASASTLDRTGAHGTVDASTTSETEVEQALDAAVRDMETLRAERRRWVADRH